MNRRDILMAGAFAGTATTLATGARAASASPHRRPVVTRDGVRLFVRDWGDGKPVVFLAGWALNSDMWAYQMAPLNDAGLRCVAYDRRGHGRSDDAGQGYDFDTLADDLHAVLEQRDLRDVTLVAHSIGGGEAVRWLGPHGASGRVTKVLFLAPALPCLTASADNPYGAPAALFEQARKAMLADFPGWIDANAGPFVTLETSAGMRVWLKDMMMQASMRAVIDCNRALTAADFRPELAKIAMPVLVVHGDKDASAPLEITGRRVAALTPGAKLIVYEGAPHGLFVTHVDRLNADIAAFAKG